MKKMENKKFIVGIAKFNDYADPRGYEIDESTYGTNREVIHNGKSSHREAVNATAKDGTFGWIVNLANRQRKFVSKADGYLVI